MTMRFDNIARVKRAKGRNFKRAFRVEAENCDGLRSPSCRDKRNAAELRKIAKLCATNPHEYCNEQGRDVIRGYFKRLRGMV
jgi:hypothetical protein